MKILNWIWCILTDHDWAFERKALPECASDDVYLCRRCGIDRRPMWMIECETICRMERLELQVRRIKSPWSPQ